MPLRSSERTAKEIAAIYLAVAGIWIVCSDQVLFSLIRDPAILSWMQTWKGWFFVAVTTVLLYILVERRLKDILRAKEMLRERERSLRTLLELSPTGLALCRLDGTLVDVNPAFAAILGRTVEETLNLTYWEITPERYADEERRQLESLVKTGTYGPYEKEYSRKDGLLVPVRLQGRFIEQGGERFIWSSVEDITERRKFEDELLRSKAFAENLIETANVLFVQLDSSGNVMRINEEAARSTGYCLDEVKGKNWFELLVPKERYPDVWQEFERITRHGEVAEFFENPILTRSGEEREILWKNKRLQEADGSVGTISFGMDITERKHLEYALAERSEQLRLFVEHSPAAIAMLDRDMRYLIVSHRWLTDYGIGDKDILGRSHYDVFPEIPAHWREIHRRCLSGAIEKSEEDSFIRPDGSTEWLHWEIRPWRQRNGEVGGLIIFSEIITPRKKAEDSLRESERKYRELVENANSIILRWGQDGRINFLNEFGQRFFGYSEDEIVGRHVVGTIVPAEVSAGRDLTLLMKRICDDPATFEENINQNMRRNGELVWISWTNRPVFDGQGQLLEILSVGSDITARKQAEEELAILNRDLETRVAERTVELQESRLALMNLVDDLNAKTVELAAANERLKDVDRLKSLFIASMSHELRTPLNSIIGFSSILLNEWVGPLNEEQRINLATVLKAGRHLLDLVNDIIDISKIEAGQVEISSDDFDLYDLCTEAAGILAEEARAKGLVFSLQPIHHPMRSDRRRLMQCLLNLISNAVKYTEFGSVEIRATLEEQGPGKPALVVLNVADTGIGISPDDQTKLFVPFVRIESPLKGEVPGTGLGLYLTRRIVESVLGGRISCKSNEGGGSIFTLRVPDRC